jgi:hypothetical protein
MHWEALLEQRVKPPYIPPTVSFSGCPTIFMEAPTDLIKYKKQSVAQFLAKQKIFLCLTQ